MKPGVLVSILIVVVHSLLGGSGAAPKPESVTKQEAKSKPDFPPFAEVAKGYEKVTSQAGDTTSLYTIWVDRKRHQMLAELKPGFENQKIFIATSIAGGERRTGWQWQELYCYWSRHHKTLVLMEPQLRRRAGDGR